MNTFRAVAPPLTDYRAEHVLLETRGAVATVTLNRPERKNPLTFESYAELGGIFRAACADESVKAFVVRGAGGNFSSGGDVHDIIGPLVAMGTADLLRFTEMTGELVRAMRACPQPIVAAVEGVCAGAGAILAMASDMRFAAPSAKVAFLFNRVGLAGCDMGACAILPRIVGQGRASELLYTGRALSAEEGERWGFFNRVVAAEDLAAAVDEMAERLTEGPTFANGMTKMVCDEGRGVGPSGLGVYLDFGDAIKRLGRKTITERYGNLFEMYERITDEDPYQLPMRIFPAVHYTMGGLWVDYNLMTSIPGLFALGEANFSDHGANRLGASALMQGLADGYFVIPYTLGDYLAGVKPVPVDAKAPEFQATEDAVRQRIGRLLSIKGRRTPTSFHRQLGQVMWDKCGMARNRSGLEEALRQIPAIREEFWENVNVVGETGGLAQQLEIAARVADFLELGELMCLDALHREESCGGHFREEYQTPDGEALRDDEHFAYVGAWENRGENATPRLHRESLNYEFVKLATRSYK